MQNSTFSNSDGNLMLMEQCTGSLQVIGSTFTQDLATSTLIFSMRYSGCALGIRHHPTDEAGTGVRVGGGDEVPPPSTV